MHDLLVGGLAFLIGILGTYRMLLSRLKNAEPEDTEEEMPIVVPGKLEIAEEPITEQEVYAVTGRPRRPSWRVRQREIEASHRTKRRAREEYRD
jgi:hypothetical protein